MGHKTNQQRGRKYGGSSSFVDVRQPSKAPHQDEDAKEYLGGTPPSRDQANDSDVQGISNRPIAEEHAVPEPVETDENRSDSVDENPKQQGGNRGRV
jgi:hypothetical protein